MLCGLVPCCLATIFELDKQKIEDDRGLQLNILVSVCITFGLFRVTVTQVFYHYQVVLGIFNICF